MAKSKKEEWINFLTKASLFKQRLENELHIIWRVPYYQMRFYSNVCIKMGRILERMHQRKIKNGERGRKPMTLGMAFKRATRATRRLKEVLDKDPDAKWR